MRDTERELEGRCQAFAKAICGIENPGISAFVEDGVAKFTVAGYGRDATLVGGDNLVVALKLRDTSGSIINSTFFQQGADWRTQNSAYPESRIIAAVINNHQGQALARAQYAPEAEGPVVANNAASRHAHGAHRYRGVHVARGEVGEGKLHGKSSGRG